MQGDIRSEESRYQCGRVIKRSPKNSFKSSLSLLLYRLMRSWISIKTIGGENENSQQMSEDFYFSINDNCVHSRNHRDVPRPHQ